jgi:transposase
MGEVTAATMLAEMGEDRARFPTADVLLAETGTAPVTRSSGRSRTVRFRYAANKRMRHAVDWWTFAAVRENDWAHEAYQQARPADSSTTARCAASAPAGHASCGGAGATTRPTIRHCT